jgi:hypothetical protein
VRTVILYGKTLQTFFSMRYVICKYSVDLIEQ